MTYSQGYQAVRHNGAGLIDLSSRGRISVGGSEAVMFLNGLITNDMKTLQQNRWMPAVFPNVQGRLIAAVRVVRLGDEDSKPTFLLDTEASTHGVVLKTIERFALAGDFRVNDVTGETSCLSVQGKQALTLVHKLIGGFDRGLERNGVVQTTWNESTATIIRASHTAEDGADVIINRAHAASLSQQLVQAGAAMVEQETFDTLRIEAGVPHFGIDMDETNVVTETNLDEAVSFTKGCYIGQEIIARIKYRGHVAKKLVGLRFEDQKLADHGSPVRSTDGKEIGRITSATFSPKLECAIGLGYVRYEFLSAGTQVWVGEDKFAAEVTELPFVRGSWYQQEPQKNTDKTNLN